MQLPPSAAHRDPQRHQHRDPRPAFVDVQDPIPAERNEQREDNRERDAEIWTQRAAADGGEGLPADHGGDDAEARHAGGVEEEGDGDCVEAGGLCQSIWADVGEGGSPKCIPRLDHLPQPRPGP